MIISDCHMHSYFSTDSDTPMENMILSAIDKGLTTICFTEHMDYDYPKQSDDVDGDFTVDMPAYEKELFSLKEKYASKIEILYGIECGMMPYLAPKYEALVAKHPFDFVISSSHLVDGLDPYFPETFFKGKTEFQAYSSYFESITKNIKAFNNFDTYGHIDYVVRYGPNQNREYSYRKYQEYLEPVLKAIIESGKALEINTGGYKKGLGQPHPQEDVLRQFKAMGGELLTIGADAHAPEHIAYGFKEAYDVLTDIGFKYYAVYKDRKPLMLKL